MAKIKPELAFEPMDAAERESLRKEAEKWKRSCNYDMAYPLYVRLAEAGDEEAKYACAEMLFHGAGREENKAAAFRLFSGLPAEKFPNLSFYLGLCYEQGTAVGQDYEKAFRYFMTGAEAGDVLCLTQLGTMYGKGHYVEKDPVKAAEYYLRASEGGDVLGTTDLAWCYANGEGVEKDLHKALTLYDAAAARREEHARDELAHFEEYYGCPEGEKRFNRLDIKIYDGEDAGRIWEIGFGGRVADITIDGRRLIDMLLEKEAPYWEEEGKEYGGYSPVKAEWLYDDLMRATADGNYESRFAVYCCCCECGQPGCWDVSFFVTETEDSVIWYGFQHAHRAWAYGLRFRFRKQQYDRQMRRLKNAERRVPDELPAQQRQRPTPIPPK